MIEDENMTKKCMEISEREWNKTIWTAAIGIMVLAVLIVMFGLR